jgi:hypothetical protein
MSFPATERAAQVFAACVSWVGEEKDVTLPATLQTSPQLRLLSQDLAKHAVICEADPGGLPFMPPSLIRLVQPPDPDYKWARLLLILLMYLFTPSSYDTNPGEP